VDKTDALFLQCGNNLPVGNYFGFCLYVSTINR